MNDRELLELAAKAAEISPARWVAGFEYLGICTSTPGPLKSWWNPLTDDGDALRLAVKLNLSVFVWDGFVNVTQAMTPFAELEIVEDEFVDKNTATRRAIVRAAAEIGKDMKC